MKVGILTFHYAHNYGAVLQAFALKNMLEKKGHNVSIINYRNSAVGRKYGYRLRPDIRKRMYLNPMRWRTVRKEYNRAIYAQDKWHEKWLKFEIFINQYLLDGNLHIYSLEELQFLELDAIICGSDQIWAKGLTGGYDFAYFLNFRTTARKISYAASMGAWKLSNKEQNEIAGLLNNFSFISVREQNLADKISELIERDVRTVVDPTLLLDIEEYESIVSTERLEEQRYVFVYYVVEDQQLEECAKSVAHELGIKLIQLHYFMREEFKGEGHLADLGPSEFLWYVNHAEFILTNSFHGTVFSILAEKLFYSVYNENNRINHLLTILNIADRHILQASEVNVRNKIHFDNVRRNLLRMRENSIQYLADTLDEGN